MARRLGTRHGLVPPRFIPPRPQRELRDLTRYRTTCVRERAPLVKRVQKVLESTNLKLASVVSAVMGVSSRALLAALVAGEADPAVLAGLAKGHLRKKRPQLEQALQGPLYPHQSFVLTELLAQIESLEETGGAGALTPRSGRRATGKTMRRRSWRGWTRFPGSRQGRPKCWWPRSWPRWWPR